MSTGFGSWLCFLFFFLCDDVPGGLGGGGGGLATSEVDCVSELDAGEGG